MAKPKSNSPLLGYNTNVRHRGKLFHIQTEDSGIDHPHIITHLFTEGTILATKKTTYSEHLGSAEIENTVKGLMKEQHKTMFMELRDGVHDATASRFFGDSFSGKIPPLEEDPESGEALPESEDAPEAVPDSKDGSPAEKTAANPPNSDVTVIQPAAMDAEKQPPEKRKPSANDSAGRSIFDTPSENGNFGDSLITDKSLDEVILSYLTDELDE